MAQKRVIFDSGPDGAGLCFEAPVAMIRADSPDGVDGAIEQIREALARGFWVTGYFSYELGSCFSDKLVKPVPRAGAMPLILLGVFNEPHDFEVAGQSGAQLSTPEPVIDFPHYQDMFSRAHRYICEGDIYQVNLTFGMLAESGSSPWDLYRSLVQRQRVGHGAFVDLGGPVVLSRSPELFFRVVEGGVIETRPMKGTVRRGADPVEDAALKAWLAASEKNRAENLMIVDLLRNDIGRVCEVGTVRVPEAFVIESFATVHQMSSLVRGKLRAGVGLPEILQALFPCGSITGAPKLRAMQIISELERDARSLYCGSVGWAAPDGRMQFNVAIRTLMMEQSGAVRFNVGGGIVYDSTAHEEFEEALWKARFADLSQGTNDPS